MAELDYQSGAPSLPVYRRSRRFYARFGKRMTDVSLALILLPLVLPLIILIWSLVRQEDAPGFFTHERVGRNGRPFDCWKIRTMVPDAQALLTAHLAADPVAAAEWEHTQKLQNDPRVTALGRFLRRTSLDELPQIWNVLRGDMSFVGPRPVTAAELDRFGPLRRSYLSQTPGITGLWQVMGRSDGCYTQRLKLDQQYARSFGLITDLSLIARTALVVVRPTGR